MRMLDHNPVRRIPRKAVPAEAATSCQNDPSTNHAGRSLTSPFCEVLKADGRAKGPDSFMHGSINLGAKPDDVAGLSRTNDIVSDGFSVLIGKRAEHLSIEVNIDRHFLTSLLCIGGLIVSLSAIREVGLALFHNPKEMM